MTKRLGWAVCLLMACVLMPVQAEQGDTVNASEEKPDRSINFFADGLERFEVWMGAPHHTVKGLPEGTPMSKDGKRGTPLGLGNVKDVFSVIEEDGKPVLKITGEIYGGLTTLESFENYHLTIEFKWGEKKWEPRLRTKRDSGLLYHCHGRHGVHASSWKACLEFQVQEKDMGDFIALGGPRAKVRIKEVPQGSRKQLQYDPTSDDIRLLRKYTYASAEPDLPNGQWNRLDLYVMGDRAVHLVNGQIVFALFGAVDAKGEKLAAGQIQLQSEAAECYYRSMVLTPIDQVQVPDEVVDLLNKP